jgi:hypothetical protein
VKKNIEQINRLKEVLECDTIGELGIKLGYNSGNAITNWKKSGVNFNRVLEYFPTIDVNYIKTGEASDHTKDAQQALESVEKVEEVVQAYIASGEKRADIPKLLELRDQIQKKIDSLIK